MIECRADEYGTVSWPVGRPERAKWAAGDGAQMQVGVRVLRKIRFSQNWMKLARRFDAMMDGRPEAE